MHSSLHTKFETDLETYVSLGGKIDEERRCDDSEKVYAVDFQYLMMDRWAFDRIAKMPDGPLHDFASKVDFASYVASIRPVIHYDIRKPDFRAPGLTYRRGDLLQLPIITGSVKLASCLHVAEHIGLGRYGDAVDPDGFNKACAELTRVIAPGGSLFFAVPVGRPKVVFNAHRIIDSAHVIDAFSGLALIEFSGISTGGDFFENVPPASLDLETYGCGLFHFVKEKS